MMLKILVFGVCVQNFLVSGNPLTLIPIQTCPTKCNCNQNSYQNHQIPTNAPLTLQNNVQQIPVIQQSPNNQLYPQPYTVQNQWPVQSQENLAHQLNQLYMNKILSNPTVQTFLDPNVLYSQLGIEMPRQVNNVANVANNLPNTQVPNSVTSPPIINNYFILPPELFENNPTTETRCPHALKREREANRRPINEHAVRRAKVDVDEPLPPENRRRIIKNQNYEGTSRREHQRRPKINDGVEREHRYSGEDRERHVRRRPIERHEHSRNVAVRENLANEKRQKHSNINHDGKRQKQVLPKPDLIINIQTPTSSENSPISSSTERNKDTEHAPKKKSRKSKDDAIIAEFHEKFPGIPEDVVRKLLSYLRRQIHKHQSEGQPHHYPNLNFPLGYDQLFPQFNLQKQRPNRRNPNRKPKSTAKPHTNVETTTNIESVTTAATTSYKPVAKTTTPVKITIGTEITETTQNYDVTEPTTTIITPTLDIETKKDISNGIYPDYYPEFTNDKQYYESDEVSNVRNLRDDRYYYTTDRNYNKPSMHEKNMERLKTIHRRLEDSFEDVLTRPDIEEHDTESIVEYRTPPLLEIPDFKTKQIVKHKPDNVKEIEKHLSYKSSTYSDAKNPSKGKHYKNIPKTDNIETVYAHSKVVKYGKSNDESAENITPIVTYYLPDNMQYEQDGKTIVIAKSIPADQFW